jgi:REP element-mobilizing transposase RayT
MSKLKHYDDSGRARFVTFSCYYWLPSLNHPGAKEIVIQALDRARDKHRFRLLGYVLMPDHVRLVLFPPEGKKLSPVSDPFEWKGSSYNWYQGIKEVPLMMDAIAL